MARSVAQASVLLLVGFGLSSGCIDQSYSRLQLGMGPGDYDRLLPNQFTRRTDLGLAYFQQQSVTRDDAIAVLVAQDRRVAAKVQTTTWYAQQAGWQGMLPTRTRGEVTGYELRGELDPKLAEVTASGPLDTLKLMIVDLAAYRGERSAMDSYRRVAAGLVRLVQRWPGVQDVGVDTTELTDVLAGIPGGGEARIAIDDDGVYRFEYRQGKLPPNR